MKHLHRLVKKYRLNKKTTQLVGVLATLLFIMSAAHISSTSQPYNYVEVGFTELSPGGEQGGRIVPASCNATDPPTDNAANYGQSCGSAANICGMTTTSTFDTCGNCPAVAPSNNLCTMPDLIAGSITPASAVAGSAINLSAVISNAGNGYALASQTLFQKATDASGTGATNIGTASAGAISVSGSVTSTYSYTFPTIDAGTTRYVRACADTGSAVAESNEANNCGPWTPVVVTATAQPDLTAGSITPTSAVAGNATTFSALVSNTGTASAGASQTFFQRANDSAGVGAMVIGSVPTASLTANGSQAASLSYTFPLSEIGTTKYMRACADGGLAVPESNEGNNCGAWTAVTVGSTAVPSVNLTATPSSINVGQSSNLTWTSAYVTSCTGTNFSTSNATNNSTGVSVSPTISTTYTITCTGSYGTVSDTKTVTVSAQPDLAAGSITPTSAVVGSATNLSALVSNTGTGNAASSQTLFQKANDASGTGATSLGSASTAAVSGLGSVTASRTYTFPAGDAGTTKYVRACADTANVVTESDETNNCGAWTAISVTATPQADLTAGAITPTNAVAGNATNLSALVSNVGTVSAGASQTLFQKANDSFGSGATAIGTISATSIAVSGSVTSTNSYTFPAGDAGTTKYVRACADTANVVTESDETNNCGAWTAISVTATPQADLTAGAITPTNAVAGNATTFSALVSNTGTGNAISSQTLFQRANDASGGGAANLGSASTAAISVSGSATTMFSYTFPLSEAGTTKYMRACADEGGAVSESNEGNNCGAWTAVTVGSAAVPSVTLTATPSSITTGQSSNLTWTSAYVTSCTGTNFSTSNATNNSTGVSVSPTVTTTYTITCTGSYGTVSDTKVVTVLQPDLTAGAVSPTNAVAGVASNFSAVISNVGIANVTVTTRTVFQQATDEFGTGAVVLGGADAAPVSAGSSVVSTYSITFSSGSAGTTKYLRACADTNNTIAESNEGNNCGAWTAVTVGSAAVPSVTLTATPSSITTGQSSNLTWTSAYVTSCTGTNFSTSNATNNSTGVSVSPTVTTIYRIDCTGPYGTANDSKTVTVGAAPKPDLTASGITPTSATAGVARTFSTTVSNIGVGNAVSSQTLFQKANDASGGGATNLGSSASASILSSGSLKVTYSYTFPVGDAGTTKYMRACADTTNLNDETNEGNNCGAWTAITILTTAQPDLTAGDISPTTAVVGTPVNLSSLVYNAGTANAAASQTLFQKANDASGGGATNLGNTSAASVAADDSVTSIYGYSFPAGDAGTTKYIRACADTTDVVSEFNEGNNCGAWTPIAVTSTAQADVTAGSVTPTSAAVGAATTFSALITNMGSSNAASSQTLFQKANDASGGGATNLGSASTAAISASGSATASYSYAFSSADANTTKYMRACADGGGVVPESNEGNNCGAWTPISITNTCVPNAGTSCSSLANSCGQVNTGVTQCDGSCSATTPPAPSGSSPTVTVAKQSNPGTPITQANIGDTLVVTWSCPAPSTSSSNNFNLDHSPSGSGTDTITASRTYEVSCNSVCGTAVVPITVPTPVLSLTASPSRVQPNQTSTLKWYATSVNSCTLTGPDVSVSANAVAGNVGSSGSPRQNATGPITGQSIYTLSCQTPAGLLTTSVSVAPVPVIIEI